MTGHLEVSFVLAVFLSMFLYLSNGNSETCSSIARSDRESCDDGFITEDACYKKGCTCYSFADSPFCYKRRQSKPTTNKETGTSLSIEISTSRTLSSTKEDASTNTVTSETTNSITGDTSGTSVYNSSVITDFKETPATVSIRSSTLTQTLTTTTTQHKSITTTSSTDAKLIQTNSISKSDVKLTPTIAITRSETSAGQPTSSNTTTTTQSPITQATFTSITDLNTTSNAGTSTTKDLNSMQTATKPKTKDNNSMQSTATATVTDIIITQPLLPPYSFLMGNVTTSTPATDAHSHRIKEPITDPRHSSVSRSYSAKFDNGSHIIGLKDNTISTRITFVTVTCLPGYEFDDSTVTRTIACMPDGSWSANILGCKARVCKHLPIYYNTVTTISGTTYGSFAKIECFDGTRMFDGSTSKTLYCDALGEWNGAGSDCNESMCSPVPYVSYASPNTTASHINVSVKITCLEGYMFPNNRTSHEISCDRGSWRPNLPSCNPIACPPVPYVRGATPSTTLRAYKTRVTYSCADRFYMDPFGANATISCGGDGQWVGDVPSCKDFSCKEMRSLNGAEKIYATNGTEQLYVTYRCNKGLRFHDGLSEKTFFCSHHNNIDISSLDCAGMRCTKIPAVLNAEASNSNASWWTQSDFVCNAGYAFDDGATRKTLTCTDRNSWTYIPTACLAMHCSDDSFPRNCKSSVSAAGILHALSHHHCLEGFAFPDGDVSKTSACSVVGIGVQWLPPLQDCQRVTCPRLHEIRNGRSNQSGVTDFLPGTTVSYSCHEGYQFPSGRLTIYLRCSEVGSWEYDDISFICKAILCPPLPTWNEQSFSAHARAWHSVVEYTCNTGFRFTDGAQKKTTTCSSLGKWIPTIEDCTEMVSISAGLRDQSQEAVHAASIGAIPILLVISCLAVIMASDISLLYTDCKKIRRNLVDCFVSLFPSRVKPSR